MMKDRYYINISIDSYEYVKYLKENQIGIVFKNLYCYFFGFEGTSGMIKTDTDALDATYKMIMRIEEYERNGK